MSREKGKVMKKKIFITVGSIIILIATIIYITIYTSFYSMSRLPQGEFISETVSSDGKYTIKAYLCNGGATTDYAVRGELINNGNNKVKNIFWQYRVTDANFIWLDNDTVKINGNEIDLPNGKYDWRNEK